MFALNCRLDLKLFRLLMMVKPKLAELVESIQNSRGKVLLNGLVHGLMNGE